MENLNTSLENITENITDDFYDEFSDCPPYNYDLLDMVDLVVGGYFIIVVCVFGVVANILAIAVFCSRQLQSNFNNLLIALAIFDLFFLVISITESVRRSFEEKHGDSSVGWSGVITTIHHHLYPWFLYPCANILLTCSVLMTVSISVERYLAIFHPLVYKNRSITWNLLCHITPVIIFSSLVNIPKFLESKVHYDKIDNSSYIGVTELRMDPLYTIYYQHWTRFILLGLLPMMLLLILNVRVFMAISTKRTKYKDTSYSIILLLIVLIFVICHTPRLILNLYEMLDHSNIMLCGPPTWAIILDPISNSLLAVNSTLNFFIYFLAGSKFRSTLISLMLCKRGNPGTTSQIKRQDTVLSNRTSFTGVRGEIIETDATSNKKQLIQLELR